MNMKASGGLLFEHLKKYGNKEVDMTEMNHKLFDYHPLTKKQYERMMEAFEKLAKMPTENPVVINSDVTTITKIVNDLLHIEVIPKNNLT